MAEYMAGSREQAPVEYGGIGDRPQGSSRRAIRMQDEWDKKQTELLQQQRLSQQMDLEQKQFEMSQRDQQIQENTFYYDRGIKEAEQKLLAQQRNAVTGPLRGAASQATVTLTLPAVASSAPSSARQSHAVSPAAVTMPS